MKKATSPHPAMTLTGKVYQLKRSKKLFYESGLDCGGCIYLSTTPDYENQMPYIFTDEFEGDVIFDVDNEDVPKKYRPEFGDDDDETFEFEQDDDFIKKHVQIIEVTTQLAFNKIPKNIHEV